MAIGSAPEIGATFKTGTWTTEESAAWREQVGPQLLNGYGILAYPDLERMARINKEWADADVHVQI